MKRKLKLNRETLRELDHRSIRSANGADTDLSGCGGCGGPSNLVCPTETCASCQCTPNTGGTRSQAGLNCNPGSGTTQPMYRFAVADPGA